uniref:Uncharacterized protein n=1 Tax=Coccidioides posadasii RMSCC 3488 TaxID=454284 RepID=A0A0J6FN83_COCPO|nr:hypothetical protein CPAG_07214 [Coccidioides posadasii RMSCC 3488]
MSEVPPSYQTYATSPIYQRTSTHPATTSDNVTDGIMLKEINLNSGAPEASTSAQNISNTSSSSTSTRTHPTQCRHVAAMKAIIAQQCCKWMIIWITAVLVLIAIVLGGLAAARLIPPEKHRFSICEACGHG